MNRRSFFNKCSLFVAGCAFAVGSVASALARAEAEKNLSNIDKTIFNPDYVCIETSNVEPMYWELDELSGQWIPVYIRKQNEPWLDLDYSNKQVRQHSLCYNVFIKGSI